MTAYHGRPVEQRITILAAFVEAIAKLHELCDSELPVIERISRGERPPIEVGAHK